MGLKSPNGTSEEQIGQVHTWQDHRVIQRYRWRRVQSKLIAVVAIAVVALVLLPLLDIVFMFAYRGALAVSISRLTTTSLDGGGIANSTVGTLFLVALSGLVAIPLGVIGGIYLAEFSGDSKYGNVIRFIADVLSGIPSILLGYVGFLVLILYFGWGLQGSGGSVLAGALILAVLMLPYILRTTELSLRKIPSTLGEAATALGSTKTQMINKLNLSLALPGIVTGIILSMSIAIGETAPLLITVGHSDSYAVCLTQCPSSYLTYIIWTFATSANSYSDSLAYLSVFLLMLFVIGLNVVARIGLRRVSRV